MSQARRSPRRVLLSRYPNGAPEEQTYGSLLAAPDAAEQMELNISSAIQVGHQLALIGDEFNRAYSRKIEDTLLHLARSVFQTWNIIKSVTRSFGNFLNNNWTKRIAGYGSWVCRLPFRCVCQKLVPAALLAVAFWWAISHGLQN
ncbi:BCL2 interacting killer isoform X2 [Gallus gallus]|uniref:BCL2 interacting killer isoform X2 n=1 Tax=Gallus gallus TaxID=9031 RepID=UPI001AE560C1|nr:BCL2 interacting killer isoform X2 [Gallus gallus]XP_046764627.1 BCL2 interacting killer isoform X2 [Gallus gallus]